MSRLSAFPKKYHGTAWLFRVLSKQWFTSKPHRRDCDCGFCDEEERER